MLSDNLFSSLFTAAFSYDKYQMDVSSANRYFNKYNSLFVIDYSHVFSDWAGVCQVVLKNIKISTSMILCGWTRDRIVCRM